MLGWNWMLAAMLSGLPAAGGEKPLEANLKFERYPDDEEEAAEGGPARPSFAVDIVKWTKAPAGAWKLPKLKAKAPVYALVAAGDEKRLLVLDSRKAKEGFYDLLYFDANGNGDLTDEKPVPASPSPEPNVVRFPAVDTTAKVGGKSFPHAVKITATYDGGVPDEGLDVPDAEAHLRVSAATHCCYRGEIQLGARTFPFLIADGDANGRFDDPALAPAPAKGSPTEPVAVAGDRLFIAAKKKVALDDAGPLGELLLLEERLYRVRVKMDGKKLSLEPVADALVPLKLAVPAERLALASEDGKKVISMVRPGSAARIPAGGYRLLEYRIEKKDPEGDLWSLSASGTAAAPPIPAGAAVDVGFGEPFQARAWVGDKAYADYKASGELKPVLLDFCLQGRTMEVVTDLKRVAGTKTKIPMSQEKNYRPLEPTYKIAKPNGQMAASGSFSYG